MSNHIEAGAKYMILNVASYTVVDLDNGGRGNGTKIQGWDPVWRSDKIKAQIWKFSSEDSGYYKLFNEASGTCMDLDNGSPKNGTSIQGWGSSKVDAQLWKFDKVANRGGKLTAWT